LKKLIEGFEDLNTAILANKESYFAMISQVLIMGLYHPLDGDTNLKYKLLCFLTPNKKIQRERHYLLTSIDAAI